MLGHRFSTQNWSLDTRISYNSSISACAKSKEWRRAIRLFAQATFHGGLAMNPVALQEHAMPCMKQLGQHRPQRQAKDKVVSHF